MQGCWCEPECMYTDDFAVATSASHPGTNGTVQANSGAVSLPGSNYYWRLYQRPVDV